MGMLTRLEIRDFALIEHAVIQPGAGLNIITGETGAGKSILIDALGAVAGNRTGKDMVRSGRDKAVVEAVFQVSPEQLPPSLAESLELEGEEIFLSREITAAGKTTARLNGRLVTASLLREVGTCLLDIHGQFDNQSIFSTEMHLSLLDRFGGSEMTKALDAYFDLFHGYSDCVHKIRERGGDSGERERRLDTLRYQLAEIENENPRPGEDADLTRRRKLAANIAHIIDSLQKSHLLLSGDEEYPAVAILSMAEAALEPAASGMDEAKEILQSVREARFTVESAALSLGRLMETIEDDPAELERLDKRLDTLFKLKRKYGGTIEAVMAYKDKAASEIAGAEKDREMLENLEKQRDALSGKLSAQAAVLHEIRARLAMGLSERICAELAALDMKSVRFHVDISLQPAGEGFGRRGCDMVEFLISPNPGEPLKPLARIASGGEASRIMLAIKTILADADRTPVLVFDEIDSGVSGRTAARVGERLSSIAVRHQVFCVTHLAQIAAMADRHLLIKKHTDGVTTSTVLEMLDEPMRREEIARLLSGGTRLTEALALAAHLVEEAGTFRVKRNLVPPV